MQQFIKGLNSEYFLIGILIVFFILFIILIILLFKYSNLNKNYKQFIKKLGNGKDIQEDLETFMYRVEKVEKQNVEIIQNCKFLNQELQSCIQKIGIVRYNAFKDTGSDLSFTLAMLDDNNNGVVLNGIYSREMSNIYAKPVENGKSNYTLSEEEKQAISKAIESKGIVI